MTTACCCDYSVNFIIKTLEDTLTTQKTTWSKGTCSSESILEQTSRVQTAGQTGASCIGLLHNTQTCLTCSDGGDQLLAKSSDSHATVFWRLPFALPLQPGHGAQFANKLYKRQSIQNKYKASSNWNDSPIISNQCYKMLHVKSIFTSI